MTHPARILGIALALSLGAAGCDRGLSHARPATSCTPICDGHDCGDDGCGGTCGECGGDRLCHVATGLCVGGDEDVTTGRVRLEYRPFRVDTTAGVSLDDVEPLGAWRLNVSVVGEDGTVLGEGHADRDGRYSLRVSRHLRATDGLVFTTLWSPAGKILLSVLQAGNYGLEQGKRDPWTWTVPLTPGRNADVLIHEADGSAALFLFLMAQYGLETVRGTVQENNGLEDVVPLALVWSPGVAWDCGACFARIHQTVGDTGALADQSIFIPGNDAGAWGWAVDFHEFGHYVARNFSRDDSPGGPHWIGEFLPPDFAWSEGWATFLSVSTASGFFQTPIPIYWDIQDGDTFWIDYEERVVRPRDAPVGVPSANGGVAQDLDESFVTSALWGLWDQVIGDEGADPEPGRLSRGAVLAALTSPRFRFSDRGFPGADLLDFLDAAACADPGGASDLGDRARALDFPYDDHPSCQGAQRPRLPVRVRWGDGRVEVEARTDLPVAARARWTGAGAVRDAGLPVLRAGERATLARPRPGAFLRIDVPLAGGLVAHVASRPDAAAPPPIALPRSVAMPPVTLAGVRLDRAIPVAP